VAKAATDDVRTTVEMSPADLIKGDVVLHEGRTLWMATKWIRETHVSLRFEDENHKPVYLKFGRLDTVAVLA
jgi:hypothetical protein